MTMPSKNSVKFYVENGYYHLYNRGVEKRNIFEDKADHLNFLRLLEVHLCPPVQDDETVPPGLKPIKAVKTLFGELELLAYCLMPNHFHLLAKQKEADAITRLMRQVCTRYSMYFNKKYGRVGSLFEGIYKGALIDSEGHLFHLTRYLHWNPFGILPRSGGAPKGSPSLTGSTLKRLLDYRYSSLAEYLGKRKTEWVKPEEILRQFGGGGQTKKIDEANYESYKRFLLDYKAHEPEDFDCLILEER